MDDYDPAAPREDDDRTTQRLRWQLVSLRKQAADLETVLREQDGA